MVPLAHDLLHHRHHHHRQATGAVTVLTPRQIALPSHDPGLQHRFQSDATTFRLQVPTRVQQTDSQVNRTHRRTQTIWPRLRMAPAVRSAQNLKAPKNKLLPSEGDIGEVSYVESLLRLAPLKTFFPLLHIALFSLLSCASLFLSDRQPDAVL